jgi:hypothetical protein
MRMRDTGGAVLFAAVGIWAGFLPKGSGKDAAYALAVVGILLVAGDVISSRRRRSKGLLSTKSKAELSITHHKTFGEIKAYALPTHDAKELNEALSFVDVTCRCYVAVPKQGETITLTSAKAKIELYDGEILSLSGRVEHTYEEWKSGDYRYPPHVEPDETIKVDCCFLGYLRWDNGWVMPNHPVIHDLEITDQFGTNHRLKKDIDFHVSWVSTPPSS